MSGQKSGGQLVELIGAMTAVEKQHFKRRQDTGSDFVLLFDYINKYGNAEAAGIRKWLKRKTASDKTYTPGYIASIKRYLREKILESLRTQHSHERTHELLSRCMNVDLLLEKGLYSSAKQELETARSKFFESGFPIDKLLLLRRWSILQFYENYEDSTQEDIDSVYHERLHLAEQVLLQIKYARILTQLSFQYFKRLADKNLLLSFMDEPFMHDESLATEFETRYLYHWVHALFAESHQMPEIAISHFEQALGEWTSNPGYIDTYPRMYLGTCFTYLKYRVQQPNPYAQILAERDFTVLLKWLSTARLGKDVEEQYIRLFTVGRLLEMRKERQFDAIRQMEPRLTKMIGIAHRSGAFLEIMTGYLLATAHFHTGDYKKADALLSTLIDQAKDKVFDNPEYVQLVFVLSLLCQYALGNTRYLRYLRSRYRKVLRANDAFDSVASHFYQMSGQLTSERYADDHAAVLERFIPRIRQALREEGQSEHLEYNAMVEWLQKQSVLAA